MTILKGRRKKRLRIIAIILLSFFLLLTIVYIFLVAHKKDILSAITTSLNQNINGRVEIGDIRFTFFESFPSITIKVKNLLVTDSLISAKSDTMLKARELSLNIPLWQMLSKKNAIRSVRLEDVKISLLKSTGGLSNLKLFKDVSYKKEKKESESSTPQPCKIVLRNVSFSFADSLKQKFFSFHFKSCVVDVKYPDSTMQFKMKGVVHFDHLLFNVQKGGYLTDKDLALNLEGQIIPKQKLISVSGGTVQVDDQLLAINSKFFLGENPSMQMNFFSRSMKPSVAYSLLTKNIEEKLSRYQVYKPVMVYTTISGSLAPHTSPNVDIYIKSSSNRISLATRSYDDLTLLGRFTNHIDSTKDNDDHNSRLAFPVFDGSVFQVPVKMKLTVTDLISPNLELRGSSDLDKASVEKIVDPKRLKIISGEAHIRFSYSGPLVNYVDTVSKQLKSTIRGSVILNNLAVNYIPSDFEFKKVNGSMVFDQNDLHINTINFELNKNTAYVNGAFIQLIPFLFTSLAATHVDLSLTAATINLNNFNFQKDTASALPEKTAAQKEVTNNHIADLINQLIDRVELNFNLHADTVLYKHFIATDVQSELTYANDFVHFKNTSMKAAGGIFSFTGNMTKLTQPRHEVDLQASIQNADISSFMKGFDYFGQNIVTGHDVDGKLKADISFHAQLNRGFNVIPSSMRGKMKVSIKDGELNNFESIEQISKYVFKNRNFRNIKFSGVENEYELEGSQITFSHLDVYSSVLTFFVEGKFDFHNTNTLMLIYVLLGNLKKAKTEELAEHPDSNRKSGIGLTLKAEYGDDNKLHITPVVFGKKKIREDIKNKEATKPKEPADTSKQKKSGQK